MNVGRGSTWVKVAAAMAGVIIAVLVAGGIGLALVAHQLDSIGKRKHLDPIPIAATACPAVVSLHDAANELQVAMPVGGTFFDTHLDEVPWPRARARLRTAVDVLEYRIVAAQPQFPTRMRRYLDTVRHAIDAGRPQLDASRSAMDFNARTDEIFARGRRAFGFASDLVGDQCPVHLAADTVYPFSTTTSPAVRTRR